MRTIESLHITEGPQKAASGTNAGATTTEVFNTIAKFGAISRADIASLLKIGRPTVTRSVDALFAAGLVIEATKVPAVTSGPPRTLLRLDPSAASVAAVDLRPDGARLVISDLRGRPIDTDRFPVPTSNPAAVVKSIADVLEARNDKIPRLAALVLGVSGAWDDTTNTLYAVPNLPGLEGVDLLSPLQSLGKFPIEIENDVRLAALAEYSEGVGNSYPTMYLISLDSGVAGAYIIGGQSHRGSRGFAGEVGYIPVWNGKELTSLESVLSTSTLNRVAASMGLTLGDLFVSSVKEPVEVVDTVARALGVAICSVVATTSPDVVVIGGELNRYAGSFLPKVRAFLGDMLPTHPPVVQAALQPSAALRGATLRATTLARAYLVQQT